MVSISTVLRQAVSVEISLSNPLNEELNFHVSLQVRAYDIQFCYGLPPFTHEKGVRAPLPSPFHAFQCDRVRVTLGGHVSMLDPEDSICWRCRAPYISSEYCF